MSRNCFQLSVWGTFVNDCRRSASQSAITQDFCIYWNFWFAMDLVASFCFTCQSILVSISSGTKIQLLTLFLFLKARGLQEHNSSQVWFWISCPFFFLVSKVRIGPLSSLPFNFSSLHNPQGGKLGRERRSLTLIELGNLLIIFCFCCWFRSRWRGATQSGYLITSSPHSLPRLTVNPTLSRQR